MASSNLRICLMRSFFEVAVAGFALRVSLQAIDQSRKLDSVKNADPPTIGIGTSERNVRPRLAFEAQAFVSRSELY